RITDGFPGAAIPQKDGAAAVLSFGDDALEIAVVEGVILDMHRQPFVPRIEARSFRDRPAFEDAFELESKIVMEPRSAVLLHDERPMPFARLFGHLARGLRSLLEVALAPILAKPHGSILYGRVILSAEVARALSRLPFSTRALTGGFVVGLRASWNAPGRFARGPVGRIARPRAGR